MDETRATGWIGKGRSILEGLMARCVLTRLVVVLVGSLVFDTGCSSRSPNGTSLERNPEESGIGGSVGVPSDEGTRITLEHDFGVVLPESVSQCRFLVRNSQSAAWTLKKVHVDCSCTIPAVSKTVFEPGQEEAIDLAYKAGGDTVDDKRRVLVTFKEAGAPVVELVVNAQVRRPLTVAPRELSLRDVIPGEAVTRHLIVRNFGSQDWKSIGLEADVGWLKGEATLIPPRDGRTGGPGPRQEWRADVRAQLIGFRPGVHHGVLRLAGEGSDQARAQVSVSVALVPPVAANPGTLFFGELSPGEKSQRKVRLAFAAGIPHPREPTVQVSPLLGRVLALRWLRPDENHWDLLAELTLSQDTDEVDGAVEVTFADERLPRLRLPVIARRR